MCVLFHGKYASSCVTQRLGFVQYHEERVKKSVRSPQRGNEARSQRDDLVRDGEIIALRPRRLIFPREYGKFTIQEYMDNCVRIIAFIFLFLLCLMFCGNEFLRAQPGGGPGGGPPPHKEKLPSPQFDKTSFDVTRERLSPVYIGHDAQQIYDVIKNRMVNDRDEKKTAGQYDESPPSKAYLSSVGTLNFDWTYAFQIRPTQNFFDARENILRVYCELPTILANGAEDKTRRGFRVGYIPWVDNHYTYTDVNGKKIEIEEVKFRDYTLVFENFKQFSVEKAMLPGEEQEIEKRRRKGSPERSSDETLKREMIIARLKIQPAEADQLKESTVVLVVCNLAEPYVTYDTVQRQGTPEKPGEYLAQHGYLHIRLLQLWFYDIVTGKVLMKMKPGDIARLP
jgi:hypothetical protein